MVLASSWLKRRSLDDTGPRDVGRRRVEAKVDPWSPVGRKPSGQGSALPSSGLGLGSAGPQGSKSKSLETWETVSVPPRAAPRAGPPRRRSALPRPPTCLSSADAPRPAACPLAPWIWAHALPARVLGAFASKLPLSPPGSGCPWRRWDQEGRAGDQ